MYPDITIDLPHEFRSPYMELLLMMAASDGDLVREELSVVEAYMGKLMIHPDERIVLRKKLENSRTYKQIISDLDEDLLKPALRDCLVVGVSDGVLDEKEISFAKRLAKSAFVTGGRRVLYPVVHTSHLRHSAKVPPTSCGGRLWFECNP